MYYYTGVRPSGANVQGAAVGLTRRVRTIRYCLRVRPDCLAAPPHAGDRGLSGVPSCVRSEKKCFWSGVAIETYLILRKYNYKVGPRVRKVGLGGVGAAHSAPASPFFVHPALKVKRDVNAILALVSSGCRSSQPHTTITHQAQATTMGGVV